MFLVPLTYTTPLEQADRKHPLTTLAGQRGLGGDIRQALRRAG
jgi:hypothetical protein